MGYWVKFNYVKPSANNFKWRAPFSDASYNKGLNGARKDNTASFKYGEKEVYHVATVETKTHIAVYNLSPREDAKGVSERYNTGDAMGESSYKLDKISLFVKKEYQDNGSSAIPIKEVHFTYNYELCPEVSNSTANGKLTLKQVHFTYQKNNRGSLNPYTFDYFDTDNDPENGIQSQPYSDTNYDRWGNYKTTTVSGVVTDADYCDDINFPYVDQYGTQAERDNNTSAWHLTKIGLPTGGTISVDYEADDYGYVQHKQAQQMFKIKSLGDYSPGQIYSGNGHGEDLTVYVDLESPVASDQEFFDRYLEDLLAEGEYQLYYKIKVRLRDQIDEYISGYASIDIEEPWGITYGGTTGFFKIKKTNINGNIDYHPFAIAAWQHMRTMQPDLLTTVGTASSSEMSAVKSLASIFPEIVKTFKGYRKYSADNGYATNYIQDLSYVRLCSPDKKKYGGGQRVKKITMSDEWDTNNDDNDDGEKSFYGQVYDYTMLEGGETISSGVAQYEPMIGGDENALRYAKHYPQSIPTMTDNNLFFEFPINESYFPAPTVGYRKVTVRSIATRDVMDGTLLASVPTTGIAEHQFYTAKDYPVITDETEPAMGPFNLTIPIPLIGQITVSNLTASQGYSIRLNNMHGKPKSIKYFAIDKNGEKILAPISSVEHYYKDKVKSYQGKIVKELVSEVKVISDDVDEANLNGGDYEAVTATKIMGVEYEFFTDMRRHLSETELGGVQINTDMIGFTPYAIPAFVPWPTVNVSSTNLSTVVTNKIIHKAGILEKTVVTDGQSTVETNNLLHDAQTGRVLLSTVNNNFDKPIYKYDIPAHWKYDGMGAAYKNWGMEFSGSVTPDPLTDDVLAVLLTTQEGAHLVPGDEFVVTYNSGGDKTLATYLGESSCFPNRYLFYSPTNITENNVVFTLYRSGRRNQLTADVSSLVALKNPTENIESSLNTTTTVNKSECDVRHWVDHLYDTRCTDFHLGSQQYQDIISQVATTANHYMPGGTLSDGSTVTIPVSGTANLAVLDNSVGPNWQLTIHADKIDKWGPDDHWVRVTLRYGTCNTYATWYYEADGTFGNVSFRADGNILYCDYTEQATFSSQQSDPAINHDPITAVEKYNHQYIDRYESTITDNFENVDVTGYRVDEVLQISATEIGEKTDKIEPQFNLMANGSEVSPYVYIDGLKGIWKPKKSYSYFDNRKTTYYGNTGAEVDIAQDGVMDNVTLFNYEHPDFFVQNMSNWKLTNEITKYNNAGYEVENKDILGVYSSAKYNESKTLPIIVASNAKYGETDFISFEESDHTAVSNEASHTGIKSIKVTTPENWVLNITDPTAGKKFNLSSWINWPESSLGFTNVVPVGSGVTRSNGVVVKFYDDDAQQNQIGVPVTISPVGKVIEGWQKVEVDFSIPIGTKSMLIKFTNAEIDGVEQIVYFDDVRIFPSAGNVNTHVYDPVTYRLSATLDENNYATIYSYDEEGNLFLVKKETVKGIKTIQESRNHIVE
jgi:hypothetical protein